MQFGNLGLAAAAYNAGPKRVQDWLASKGKGRLPDETQGYVKTVTGSPAETWRVASAGGTALTVPRHAPCQEIVPPAPQHHDGSEGVRACPRRDRRENHARQARAEGRCEYCQGSCYQGSCAPHKPPIQQLAARKHKAAHKNQKLAQR